MSHSTIIFDNTVVCRESFKKALTIPHLRKDEWAETRFADFNLWAAGAGASAKGKGSLDVRLAFEEEGRNIVANLLRMLQVLMDKCIEIAGAMNSTIEAPLKYTSEIMFLSKFDECDVLEVVLSAKEVKAMNDVESILNELIAVTVAIRKAGSHSRRHKADSEFDPTNPQISALRDHLEIVVLTRRSPDSPPFAKLSYGRADIIPSSKEGTSRQLSEIQRRLIDANLHRRNRFLYSQRHSEKLAYDIKESSQGHHSPPPSLASLQKLGHWPDKAIAAIGNNVKQDRATQEILEEITKSTTTASLIEDPIVFPGAGPAESAVTGVSSTISKVQYPKAPNIRNNMSSFKCPCCCQTLPRTVSLGKRWKKHLEGDILPYTCILNECPCPTELYINRQGWVEHMNKQHNGTRIWMCFACTGGDPRPSFNEEVEFVSHIEHVHQAGIKSSQIPILVSAWSRSIPAQITECPLCHFQDKDRGLLLDHVAKGVHNFSLRSLPWGPGENVPDSDDQADLKGYFMRKDNPYFAEESEQSYSKTTEESLSNSLKLEHLPSLDYTADNSSKQLPLQGIKLTEDVIKDVQRDLTKEEDLSSWISTILSLDDDSTGLDRIKLDDPGKSSEELRRLLWITQVVALRGEFVPESSLDELITVPTIAKIDKEQNHSAEVDALWIANRVCTSAKRLYATLILLEQEASIRSFLAEGISDEDLPFDMEVGNIGHYHLKREGQKSITSAENWADHEVETFHLYQWRMTAPIFHYGDYHDLNDNAILPFVNFKSSDARYNNAEGGFSHVYAVRIHRAHHNFWQGSDMNTDSLVAIKVCHDEDSKNFRNEVTMLKTLVPKKNPHLIQLLATYKHRKIYHLMFPWADSHLGQFWKDKPTPKFHRATVLWSLQQMCGIAQGLSIIHECELMEPFEIPGQKRTDITGHRIIPAEPKKLGRHGGIQADNTLWFKDKATSEEVSGVLKIGGFSMVQFHEIDPNEGVDPATAPYSLTYRSPELELLLPIFRSSDIWSLACLYLEFITWLLKGDEGIKEFSLFRLHISYYTSVQRDSFFTLAGIDDYFIVTASVSGKVIAWIDRLHEHERCSALIHDFLDLIMEKLLVIDSEDRCTASWLHEQLLGFLTRASEDDDYLLEPIPRIPEGSRDFPDIVTSDSMDNLRKVVQ
ncbi:uncharacterized protein PAC_17179 [Phialocephala subalpina]|uniref:Protein kinase domain-containing protein n=1 Tax=Phialocephala subalpina TaxID=576137 RepID=A0A1L7XQG1_9HELO|nr:uncharacterized protein PAC_17179 [Phialocephala subalpina]